MSKSSSDQELQSLPLFSWTPSRRVLVMPPARVRGFVCGIVDKLASLPERPQRDRRWQRTCNDLRKRMTAAGEPADVIDKHIDDLHTACEGEQRRRRYEGERGRG